MEDNHSFYLAQASPELGTAQPQEEVGNPLLLGEDKCLAPPVGEHSTRAAR